MSDLLLNRLRSHRDYCSARQQQALVEGNIEMANLYGLHASSARLSIYKQERKKNNMLGQSEIQKRFGAHKASIENPVNVTRHVEIRDLFTNFVLLLDTQIEDGRQKSLMMTKLEEASMWAHKSLADEKDEK